MYDRSGQILAVAILFFVLSWVSVGLRVYVKARILKQFGWDDGVMLATLGFFTAYLVCQLGGLAHGTGKHRAEITDEDAQTALMFWFLCELFYTISTCILKVAIGLFFLRIANNRYHIWIIKIIIYSSALIGVAYCCVSLFQCKPISYWWDLNPNHHGKCISPSVMVDTTYTVSALNSLADWVFGLLPIFIVKDLQMKSHTKVVVAVVLGFAAVGSAATIIRMPYIWTVKEYKGEFLWRTTDVAIWTTVEVGIGITAGNIATLRPLLHRVLDLVGVNSTVYPSTKWTYNNRYESRSRMRSNAATPLEDFGKLGKRGETTTTVTIRGGAASPTRETEWTGLGIRHFECEEDFVPFSVKGFGILQSVEFQTTEERAKSIATNEIDEEKGTSPKPTQAFERL